MASIGKIARRTFLFGAVALAGGAAFGWWKYKTPYGNPLQGLTGSATLNPYVLIAATGVTLIAPRAEMGQGVHTTLAALVAEEMDLDLASVRVIHGPDPPPISTRACCAKACRSSLSTNRGWRAPCATPWRFRASFWACN